MSDGLNIEEKTKESLIWNTVLPGFYQIFRFVIAVFIARLLDPKDFGIMSIASIVVFYTNDITNFGFSTALIQKKNINEKHVYSVFILNISISLLLTIILILTSRHFAVFFNLIELEMVLICLSPIFLLTSLYMPPLTVFKRNLQYKTISKIEVFRGAVQSFTSLSLALLGFSYWSLVWGLILSNIVGTILIIWKSRWVPRIIFDLEALREIFGFAAWNFGAAQLRLLNDYFDKFLIGKFIGAIQLGYYEKAYGLANMPIETISHRISDVMFSTFSRVQHDEIKSVDYLRKTIILMSLVCFPIYFGCFAISEELVLVLFGEKWESMVAPMKWMLPSFMIVSISNIFSAFNTSSGKYKSQIITRVICLSLFMASICFYADKGILIISQLFFIYQLIFFIISVEVSISKKIFRREKIIEWILPSLFFSSIMFLIIELIEKYIFHNIKYIELAILVFVGFISYFSLFLVVRTEETEFYRKKIWDKILIYLTNK